MSAETERVVGLSLASVEKLAQAIASSNGWTHWSQHEFRQAEHILASPEFAALVAGAQRDAWEVGYEAFAGQFTQPMDEAGQRPKATNPYPKGAGDDE